MNKAEITDVQDLRTAVKDKNLFKKSLLGYDMKEINNYISSLKSSRLLENTAFMDRINELEGLVKTKSREIEELDMSLDELNGKVRDYEEKLQEQEFQLSEHKNKINEAEEMLKSYEIKLQEKEDNLVFLENENLKQQLASVTKERDDHGAQCEILKGENEFYAAKVESLENENEKLMQRLSLEMDNSRALVSKIRLQAAKIVEGNSFLNERTTKVLEELLIYNNNFRKETDSLTEELKQNLLSFK